MRFLYTPDAINDLERLREFIEPKNPKAAQRIATELLDGISNLAVFLKMGLPVSRAPDPESIRDLYVGQYTVRYLSNEQNLVILRVWHDKEVAKNL